MCIVLFSNKLGSGMSCVIFYSATHPTMTLSSWFSCISCLSGHILSVHSHACGVVRKDAVRWSEWRKDKWRTEHKAVSVVRELNILWREENYTSYTDPKSELCYMWRSKHSGPATKALKLGSGTTRFTFHEIILSALCRRRPCRGYESKQDITVDIKCGGL